MAGGWGVSLQLSQLKDTWGQVSTRKSRGVGHRAPALQSSVQGSNPSSPSPPPVAGALCPTGKSVVARREEGSVLHPKHLAQQDTQQTNLGFCPVSPTSNSAESFSR